MQANDFTGSYDWPAEEAKAEAEAFADYFEEYSESEIAVKLAKLKAHWAVVFGNDSQGSADMARFCEVFNSTLARDCCKI